LLDRLCVGIKTGNLGLVVKSSDTKILLNTNVIKRAEKIIPYLMYDEEPYLVISDEGELFWVIDAYTASNDYPYSQKTKLVYKNDTREINYIRNSVKVIVNAFSGETSFYITDKTDPIAMVYNNMYSTLFKDMSEIPNGISKSFTYSEFLYKIQSEMLNIYHDISADVLYRGNDIWEIASYSSLPTKTAKAEMKPVYTLVKEIDTDESKLGLVISYNQFGKESLNAYLIRNSRRTERINFRYINFQEMELYFGPMQLDNLIEQDETISAEISALNVTGTKISKEMIIVPIDKTLLYVVPIYQTSLNETNSVPVLKKVVVASGNKVAIGDNLSKAIKNLLSPNGAVSIEVEDTSTIEGLVEAVIKANNNLKESNDANDWSQIGRDIEALQALITQLEKAKEDENGNNESTDNTTINENSSVDSNNVVR